MEKKHKCPVCGQETYGNWPVNVAGTIMEGGCDDCWEQECDDAWWDMLERIGRIEKVLKLTNKQNDKR